ncbi:hypothetical protein SAMN02745227_01340 [Anaerobranca californiensis DSM 14826]|jgi:hypothetical protein|uniref:Coat F domain-containing protein n=2 Tax=Anaerobranca TaxID=42447 RepID=A0A1M6P5K7_9FIRM|nr:MULTISPECIES: hypothetical protein [Anaerobranca]SET20498.1 hypothetical protein SAMN03080614_10814 [Anaerobranca gottschalkii DSM 13577]SHK03267.1 hypothetical protein SAMN02745227_01340 [Anaerobranca californiensis DSM 14826]
MLTQKELLYLEDALSAEQLAMAKLRFYAEQTNDPQVREECQNLANKHQQHYNKLLKHLNPNQNLQ